MLLPYWPAIGGRFVVGRDVLRFVWPARAFLGRALRAGEIPLWNPEVGLGLSAFADPLLGVFYPPNLLFAVASGPWAVTFMLAAHLLFGGLGVRRLARVLGICDAGSTIAAVAWMLSGITVSQTLAGVLMMSAAYMPWCALVFLGALRRPGRWPVLHLGGTALLVAAPFLLGEYFMALVEVGFGAGLALAVATLEARREGRPVEVARRAARLVIACALAATLAAAALLPSWAAAAETARAQALPSELAELWSVHPERLFETVLPRVFGISYLEHGDAPWTQGFFDGTHPLFLSLYLGGSVVFLALLAPGRRRPLAWVLLGLAGSGVLLALGRHTPVHGLLRTLVPPLARMRSPEKYMVIVALPLVLAAGLASAAAPVARRRFWLTVSGLAAMLALPAVFPCAILDCALAAPARAGALHGAGAVLAVAMALTIRRRWPRWGAGLLTAVVAADLLLAMRGMLPFAKREFASPPAAAVALAAAAASPAPPRLYREPSLHLAAMADDWSSEEAARTTLLPNLGVAWRLAVLPGYDAGLSPLQQSLLDAHRPELLGLLGAQHALLSPRLAGWPGFELPQTIAPDAVLCRVRAALPRVYAVAASRVAADDELATALLDPEVLAGRLVLVPPGGALLERPPARAGDCRLLGFRNNALLAECDLEAPGLVVFVEQFARGWRAAMDGRPVPLRRANGVLRAVPASPGRHRIELRFSPPGLPTGLAVSAATAILLLVLGAAQARRALRR